MKSALIILILFISFINIVSAQNDTTNGNVRFGIDGTIGFPTGTYSKVEAMAYDFGLHVEFPASKNIYITLNSSYISFTGKNGMKIVGGMVPVLFGGKFLFSKKLFGQVEFGPAFITESNNGNAWAYSPSIGYNVSKHFDLSFKYLVATKNNINESSLGLKLGITL